MGNIKNPSEKIISSFKLKHRKYRNLDKKGRKFKGKWLYVRHREEIRYIIS